MQTSQLTNMDDILDGKLLSINEFFNELPVRIVGTHEIPIFYANEVVDILNIGGKSNIWRTLKTHIHADHIVSDEQLDDMGIKKFRLNGKVHKRAVMINIEGVYALLQHSTTRQAVKFRKFVETVMNRIRTIHVERLGKEIEFGDGSTNEYLKSVNQVLTAKCVSFRDMADRLYVFKIKRDTKKIVDGNSIFHVDDQLDSDDEEYDFNEDPDDENTIDNYDAFAKAFPEMASDRKCCYKFVRSLCKNDQDKYILKYYVYTNHVEKLLKCLDKHLYLYKIGKDKSNIYMCDWEKICDAIGKQGLVEIASNSH